MTIDLTGQHALVCGSTRGIGWASAQALAAAGARITLLARDESALQTRLAELNQAHPHPGHAYATADFAQPEQLPEALAAVLQHSRVDILQNNTGGPPGGPLAEARPAELDAAFRMHLLSAQHLLQAVLPGMREAGRGRIINVISTSVKQPIPGLGVSNTVRGAMANWAKTLAGELGPAGITVNNVLPGYTHTDRLRSLIARKAETSGQSPAEVDAGMKQAVPARRFASPAETAAAVLFLASPQAAYINGINLPVDGGRTASL